MGIWYFIFNFINLNCFKDFVAEQKLRLEKSLQKSTIEENFNNENLKKFIKEREKEVAEKKRAIQEIQKRTKAIIAASKSHEDKVIKVAY